MLAMNNEYIDVFEETVKYTGTSYGGGEYLAFVGASLLLGMWFLSGMPGYAHFSDKISSKAHLIVCWCGLTVVAGLAAVGLIMGFTNVFEGANEMGKLRDVQTHMEENVAKKYDATLQVSLSDIPTAEDRDKPNDYTLVFNDEDDEKRLVQRYDIRFDRETSEPFISELDAPTADELEEVASK